MLQKRFVDENGDIHYFDKSESEKGVQRTKPKKLLMQLHLYSTESASGVKDATLENEYSALENATDPLIGEMLEIIDEGRYPKLSASAHELWATFVYHQWRRTPDMQSRIMSPSNALAIIETGLKDIEEKNGKPLDREVREKFLDPKYVTRFHQNARVKALRRQSPEILGMLKAKGLFFGHCSCKDGFILGSSPIIKIGRVGSELSDPAVEVWLPISPHVCAVLGGAPNDGQLVWMTRPQVRKINLIIETNSSVFAGNSRSQIESIVSRLTIHQSAPSVG
jgi:hypothetical protein